MRTYATGLKTGQRWPSRYTKHSLDATKTRHLTTAISCLQKTGKVTALKVSRVKLKNLRDLLAKHGLTKIRLNAGFMEAEFSFEDADKDAAWEMYVEMLTRIVTQPLPDDIGDETTALDSVYELFPITRAILRQHGRQTIQFSKVIIPILNQVV